MTKPYWTVFFKNITVITQVKSDFNSVLEKQRRGYLLEMQPRSNPLFEGNFTITPEKATIRKLPVWYDHSGIAQTSKGYGEHRKWTFISRKQWSKGYARTILRKTKHKTFLNILRTNRFISGKQGDLL